MFAQDNQLDPQIVCPDQFSHKTLVLLANVPAKFLKVCFSVNHQPGVVQALVVANRQF